MLCASEFTGIPSLRGHNIDSSPCSFSLRRCVLDIYPVDSLEGGPIPQRHRRKPQRDRQQSTEQELRLADLHQSSISVRAAGSYLRRLRSPPVVDVAHLVHATDGAVRRATLLGQELTLHVRPAVLSQWNARIATLLRAVMHQPELADVEITPASAAPPVIRLPVGDRFLKMVEPRVAPPP